ncbi:MAG: Eco57I restriction-modification methylase domain-containing protein [Candidatus Bipolaricaulia bacterium]
MTAFVRQQAVLELLKDLRGLNPLKQLFWSELNYERVNQPLPRREWPDRARNALAEDPVLFACGGQNNDFYVIYVRLASDRLLLGQERPVVSRLLKDHPYALFIFSNEFRDRWHFLNVKYDGKDSKRRLFRRITIGPEERLRTACERLAMLDVETIPSPSPLAIQQRHDEAFDVEAVTQKFFESYKQIFYRLQNHLHQQTGDAVWSHDYALNFLNRLMFLYFIQRKRWLGEDPEFIKSFWEAYHKSGQPQDTFFKDWVSVLFFEAFNNKFSLKPYLPSELNDTLLLAPFLNGGLFRRNELDEKHRFNIPDRIFADLIHDFERNEPGFFEYYNFTIAETTPLDQEVAVDPEMIGRVYESLVNITFEGLEEEDLRGTAGIFYTPRIEIDLMCHLALVDYLTNQLGENYKSLLYEAVFAYEPEDKQNADEQLARKNLWPQLEELLREITVLDPACGSGSFLVGMLLLLDDLLARADGQLDIEEPPYERRRKTIGRSLYGVDVMEWAVHVAELRLWLQLVVETELESAKLQFRPLLPNLSFKVRPGDSLVQEVGGISFTLHRAHPDIPRVLKRKLTQLKGEKRKFYNNDPNCRYHSEMEVNQAEFNLFQEILESKTTTLQDEIAELTRKIESPEKQLALSGIERVEPRQLELKIEDWKRQREELETEQSRLRDALQALHSSAEVPFVWDIAFVEIFGGDQRGFDIVIGNPPYVRQEKIAPPTVRPEEHGGEDSEEWKRLKKGYKAKLQRSVAASYPRFFSYKPTTDKFRKLDGKSDYYVYFYLHGLSLLNELGSFCFITSNSWLDVGYGKELQEFLLRHSQVKMILDNEAKRSFAQSDVNTIIALLAPTDDKKAWGLDQTARFVMFKVPFEEILHPAIFEEIEEVQPRERGNRKDTPDYRAIAIGQHELYKEGLTLPEEDEKKKGKRMVKATRYIGNKWGGKYLRAPEIFFTILERAQGKLVRLGEIAEVRFGIKTGANKFFYLKPTSKSALEDLVFVRNGAGWEGCLEAEFLKPVIKSPREIKTIRVHPEDLHYKVFMCHLSKEELKEQGKTHALEYIEWGERQRYHKRPTCASRQRWWDLGRQKLPVAIWFKAFNDRFIVPSNNAQCFSSDRFYAVYPEYQNFEQVLNCVLNTTITNLMVELTGRVNLGEGALDNMTYEAALTLIPHPSALTNTQRTSLLTAFDQIADREIKNIFKELGLPKPSRDYSDINPEDISLDKVLPDRRALDEVVFDVLGLTKEEQLEVYRAVVTLVKNRLTKAKSV